MEKTELAYIVRIKVWDDSPKVRQECEDKLNQLCGLHFITAEVDDANGLDCV